VSPWNPSPVAGVERRAIFDGPTIELEIVEVTDEVLRLKWLGP
jgi:hypothetical protein